MDIAKVNDNKQLIFYGIIVIVLLWVLYLFLKKIKLIPSEQDLKDDKNAQALKDADFLAPNYYKDKLKEAGQTIMKGKPSPEIQKWIAKNFQSIGNKDFLSLSKLIWDSKGFFRDNESGAISAMKKMQTKVEASLFSDWFFKTYSKDLSTFFDSYMSDAEMSIIYNHLKALPIYK